MPRHAMEAAGSQGRELLECGGAEIETALDGASAAPVGNRDLHLVAIICDIWVWVLETKGKKWEPKQ